MKLLFTAIWLTICCYAIDAQVVSQRVVFTAGNPPTVCVSGKVYTNPSLNPAQAWVGTSTGACTQLASGGASGTVTVVASGSLTSTALVTGGGAQTIQTPFATATLDSSGNIKVTSLATGSSPPTLTVGTGGAFGLGEGTAATAAASVVVCYADSTRHLLNCSFNNGPFLAITNNLVQNSQSAAYTTVMNDAGASIYHPSADVTARTWTIDSNANVAYPIGTTITFVNDCSAGTITIAITTDTLVLAGAGTTGSRTLAACGVATAIKVTSVRWIINGTGLT